MTALPEGETDQNNEKKGLKETFLKGLRWFKRTQVGSRWEMIATLLMFALAIYGVLYDVPQIKLQVACISYCKNLSAMCSGAMLPRDIHGSLINNSTQIYKINVAENIT